MSKNTKPVIMVSSVVYGIEELLERVYALLTAMGYEVWMFHKGTMPVVPDRTAFENCLTAVENCDIFLSIITPQYGSGKDKNIPRSIVHDELLKAIKLDKPRWILAHDHVVFARSLLRNLGYKTKKDWGNLKLKKSDIFEDLRVIEMFEAAIKHEIKDLNQRKGNWVQKFFSDEDVQLFAFSQFYRFQDVEIFLKKQKKPEMKKNNKGRIE